MQRSLLDDGILRVCSGMLLKSWRWALLACRQLPCPVLQLVQSKTSWQSAIWIASYRHLHSQVVVKSQHRTSDYVELPHHVSQVDLPFSSIFSIWYSNKLLYTNATHLGQPLKRNIHSMNPEHKRRSKRRYEKDTKKTRKRYNDIQCTLF